MIKFQTRNTPNCSITVALKVVTLLMKTLISRTKIK